MGVIQRRRRSQKLAASEVMMKERKALKVPSIE